jgi:type IV fimbrial biogenesis protein FimT
MRMNMAGMTLIEAIITVAVAGIILAWGLPNLADYVRTSRVVSTANDMLAALTAARTFAVTRSVATVVCPSSNGTSCTASTTWGSGWIVFEDCDGGGDLDAGAVSCPDGSRPETVIRVAQFSAGTVQVRNESGSPSSVGFAVTGIPSATGHVFSICTSTMPKSGHRTINLNAVGQATVGQSTNTNECES